MQDMLFYLCTAAHTTGSVFMHHRVNLLSNNCMPAGIELQLDLHSNSELPQS